MIYINGKGCKKGECYFIENNVFSLHQNIAIRVTKINVKNGNTYYYGDEIDIKTVCILYNQKLKKESRIKLDIYGEVIKDNGI